LGCGRGLFFGLLDWVLGETMTKPELLDLNDVAQLYKCSRRHARDVITKRNGWPDIAPASSPRNPLWLSIEVRAFLMRKQHKSRTNPAQVENRL